MVRVTEGETGSCSDGLMGGAIVSKSLIQFSVDGWGRVPSLLFDLSPNYCGGSEDNSDLLQKVPCTAVLSVPRLYQATANPCLHQRLLYTHRQVWVSLLWGHYSYIYYCGQGSLRRNGVALIVNKRVQNVVLGCSLKNDRMICSCPRQTIQYHSNPSLCPNQ